MSLITLDSFTNTEKTRQATKAYNSVREIVPYGRRTETMIIVFCYLLSKGYFNNTSVSLNAFVSEYINGKIDDDSFNRAKEIASAYSPEDYALAAFFGVGVDSYTESFVTPSSIATLAFNLLGIRKNDSVADICSGVGSFLIQASSEEPEAKYYGYDVNADCIVVSSIRFEMLGYDIALSLNNVFDLVFDEQYSGKKFKKIFSNYPFGLSLRYLGDGKSLPEKIEQRYPWTKRNTSSDWVFNSLICDLLDDDGKAIVVMTNGSLLNATDSSVRRHFLDEGLIEAVISLPKQMFSTTSLPTSIVVFSKGNKSVRIIDASEWVVIGRRINTLSSENITKICAAMEEDGDHSCLVSVEELKENDCRLSPNRYLSGAVHFENGQPFSTVINRITRGAPCNAKELDEITTDTPTNMQYLMLADIKKGQISENLPYLKNIEQKYEKYCLKENNLILSKNGYPFKVAVVPEIGDRKILGNGNLYIIEVDETKANPYYLKAFFESDAGVAALNSISVGTAQLNIGVDALKNLEIPVPSLEEQNRLAARYLAKLDEIKMLRMSLEKAEEALANIFDEEVFLG